MRRTSGRCGLLIARREQHPKERRNSLGADAGAHRVRYGVRVRLGLGFAAVMREPGGAADVDRDAGGLTIAEAGDGAEKRDADAVPPLRFSRWTECRLTTCPISWPRAPASSSIRSDRSMSRD